jgi:isopenicillin N synthase-like dioxygenase
VPNEPTGLRNFTEIPIIDVSGLYGTEDERQAVAAELGRAAREVGFLYVTGSGVPEEYFQAVLEQTKRYFALPLEEKLKTYIGQSSNHRGYVPTGEEGDYGAKDDSGGSKPPDLKEAFDLSLELPADDPDYLAGNPMLGPNRWPEHPDFADMRVTVNRYYEALIAFGKLLLQGFALALGEPADRFDPLVTRAPSQLRLMHYPVDPDAVDRPGIGAHTDFEVFTLLRSTEPGLEVCNGAGDWIDAPPVPGAFIVNIGDMLDIWSNGTFVSTTHRVRKVGAERYSFPLFFNVDYDVLVEPLPPYVRGDGTDKRPLKAGEHLYAQTIHAFGYLRRRLAAGEITMPDGSVDRNSFGREAMLKRQQDGAADPTLVSASAAE